MTDICLLDCQMAVSTTPLSGDLTCLIKDTCTSVSCCMDVNFLQRAFETYVTIDPCNYLLEVGIEKLYFNVSLNDFTFGRWNGDAALNWFKVGFYCTILLFVSMHAKSFVSSLFPLSGTTGKFYLNGIVRIEWVYFIKTIDLIWRKKIQDVCTSLWILLCFFRYTIEDMPVERQFKVSLVLKVCFEATDDSKCILSLDVLKDTLLPKSICDWVADFSTPSKQHLYDIAFKASFYFLKILRIGV